MSNEAARRSAVSTALSSIRKDKWFPEKVLTGRWEDYLFFEPYMMFVPGFIDATKLLLTGEKASVIALINLGNATPIDYENPPAIFIEEDTGATEYISELESKGAPLSWMVMVDRYICVSAGTNGSQICQSRTGSTFRA